MTGFPAETRAFLAGIAADNSKAWFDANRALYEAGFVAPAKAFVAAIGPRLKEISPDVQFEPRVNGSISRINRDIRFSKDKRPYKDHLDLIFWHGDKRSFAAPGFWFRMTAGEVMLGVGCYRFEGEMLDGFRQSIVHPRSGRDLLQVVDEIKASGDYEIGEKTRKRPPAGFSASSALAEYLLYEGLFVSVTLPVETAQKSDLVETCLSHYRRMWPIGAWIDREIG